MPYILCIHTLNSALSSHAHVLHELHWRCHKNINFVQCQHSTHTLYMWSTRWYFWSNWCHEIIQRSPEWNTVSGDEYYSIMLLLEFWWQSLLCVITWFLDVDAILAESRGQVLKSQGELAVLYRQGNIHAQYIVGLLMHPKCPHIHTSTCPLSHICIQCHVQFLTSTIINIVNTIYGCIVTIMVSAK